MRILVGLVVVLALALPASANLLSASEGGFEDPWPSQPNAWGGHIERDSSIWGPGAPVTGAHYGSIQTGGGGSTTMEISITSMYVVPGQTATLTGWYAGGTLGPPTEWWIQLIDGSSSDDTVVAELRFNAPGTVGFGWTPFTLTGHIRGGGHVKIKAGFHIGGWSNGTALHLDSLNLVPEPASASLALFGLAGLPFLRRRR